MRFSKSWLWNQRNLFATNKAKLIYDLFDWLFYWGYGIHADRRPVLTQPECGVGTAIRYVIPNIYENVSFGKWLFREI